MTDPDDPAASKPRHLHITTGDMTVEQALAMARSFVEGRFEIEPLGTDPPKLSGAADFWMLEHVMFADNIKQSVAVRRNPKDDIGESVRFRVVTGGALRGRVDNQEVFFTDGDIAFDTYEAQLAIELDEFSCLSFGVSTPIIGYDPARHVPWKLFDKEDPAARMFAKAAKEFAIRIVHATAEEADRMGLAMLGLLRGMLEGMARDSEGEKKAGRSLAMRRFIDANLDDPKLSAETLLAEFPVSRSVVYREFNNVGGVARFITGRRMTRALHLLTTGDRNTKIGDVARAVGYNDQRHFARQFGKHYGRSPSEARKSAPDSVELDQAETTDPREIGERKRSKLTGSEHMKS